MFTGAVVRWWAIRRGAARRSLWTRLVAVFVFMILLSVAGRAVILLPPLRAALLDLAAGQTLTLTDHVARRVAGDLRLRLEALDRIALSLPAVLPVALPMEAGGVLFPEGLSVASVTGDSQRRITVQAAAQPESGGGVPLILEVPVLDRSGRAVARLTGGARLVVPELAEPTPDASRFQLIFPAERLALAASGVLLPLSRPGGNALIDRALAGFRGMTLDTDDSGEESVSAVVAVSGTDWLLIGHDDMAEALAVFQGTRALVVGATPLVALFLIAITLLILRGFLKPLTDSARGIHRMATGEAPLRPLPVVRLDEVGDLAQGFNILLARLEAMTEQKVAAERLRAAEKERMESLLRQWMADTSHELRTPIAVLRAQIEAIQDGIFAADAKRLGLLHGEVMGMERLVGELFTLARSDIGQLDSRFEPVEVAGLIDDTVGLFRERYATAGLTIDWTLPEGEARVNGDAARLRQVFANLLENSLRYTDAGGRLRIVRDIDDDTVTLLFDDSPPGVPTEALSKLFDRFFRVDVSRSRALGGSGIGLALCHSLIAAHGGSATASHSPFGGLRIALRLPRLKDTP